VSRAAGRRLVAHLITRRGVSIGSVSTPASLPPA
jgi:hypothetical protein